MSLLRWVGVFLVAGATLHACLLPPAAPLPSASPTAAPGLGEALKALTEFLTLLQEHRFEEAAAQFSGPYEMLRGWRPDFEASDLPDLLESACRDKVIVCLLPMDIRLKAAKSDATFEFVVQYANADGSLFVRGPCCGASETEMPSQSEFDFTVVRSPEGNYGVQDLPPYLP